jgi:hypothetical protein
LYGVWNAPAPASSTSTRKPHALVAVIPMVRWRGFRDGFSREFTNQF